MKSTFLLLAALCGIICLTLQSFPASPAPSAEAPTLTYSQDTLHVTIPYRAPRAGAGQLTITVLDPDDRELGRSQHHLVLPPGNGSWHDAFKLAKPLPLDELAWQRLRYTFSYDAPASAPAIQGTDSVSEILRMPVVHILGQQAYLSGGRAAVRVIVTDSNNQPISGPSSLRVELAPPGRAARPLFAGRLNARGTAEAQFRFPDGLVGSYPLRYVADTPIGAAEFTQQVRLDDRVQILLTTEKPIYQPGQTIHARVLALDRAHREAAGARGLAFEVEDSRGNKVFKKATRTDKFGIASAEFQLADEVNLGTYHLRAIMGAIMGDEESAANTSELALNVDRYVLPKFKVSVDLDGGDHPNRARRGYRPGDRVTGTVRANYFFGKPVDNAVVDVKATGVDVGEFHAVAEPGKTTAGGDYRFSLRLPDYFAGRPLTQGAAAVLIEATVKDAAGHAETRGQPITVSESPLTITAVPEGGTLIPNLENQIFIVTAYPDGAPAIASLKVHAAGAPDQAAATDDGGVAVIRLRPGERESSIQIEATDREGNRARRSILLEARGGPDQVLLHTQHAVYRAGDRIALQVLSTKRSGAAYVDVVKDGQTVLTRDVDIVNGQGQLALTATPDLAGAIDIHAYVFAQDAQPVGDHRLVFVQPADDLTIEAAPDAPSYKPGDEARIRFRVTNSRGEGVPAALGLQIVDEAVFALAEKQPGMAKVFFYLEQEAMQPRYEIHSLGMPDVVEPVPVTRAAQRDRAARALFAATEIVAGNRFETEFGRSVPMNAYAAWFARYQQHYLDQIRRIRTADLQVCADAARPAASCPAAPDAWGTKLRVERLPPLSRKNYFQVSSAGPDKQFGTADDLTGYLEVRGAVVVAVNPLRKLMAADMVRGMPGAVMGGIGGDVVQVRAFAPTMATGMALAAPAARLAHANGSLTIAKTEPMAPAPRVRSYFPEALYISPEIVTDQNGAASIVVPLADSITTWRMAMLASTSRGALGSGVSSLKVFQDFFVDLDLPVTLTQGDRVSIPVAVYNYSAARGDVRLELEKEPWFTLDDEPAKTVAVDSGAVGVSRFTIEAQRIGKFKLTLAARMAGGVGPADTVVREIEVVPNGRQQDVVFNGRLDSSVARDVNAPPAAIAEAGKIFVRLYPGPLSQVVEGMDAILRMPFGCFEQTSSATYPNVLALDYMKRTKKLTPEVHAKAEAFIANGYQRLLTFEVPGGGFSWFGNPPANKILTAYGLMEFSDMSRVHDVDTRLIERTQQWLVSQQQTDGSWKPDAGFINEGATNRYNDNVLRITAYLAWSLENTGYKGPAVDKAKEYVAAHSSGKVDSYTLAVIANFAAEYGRDSAFARHATQALLDARTEKDEQAWWTAEETGLYGSGLSGSVETTGLAVQALLKLGAASTTASHALRYIAAHKDASGTWGATQATIMALRALLLSTEKGAADVRGTVELSLDGKPVQRLVLTPENDDLLHQFVFPVDPHGAHRVALHFDGKGGLAYQIVGQYFVPWEQPAAGPLSIGVAYDRTHLAQDDIAQATATVKNNLSKTAKMVMLDLGIPPGFDLLSEDPEAYLEKSRTRKSGRLEKFNLTATQAILYFDAIAAGDTVTLPFRLRAKYPIRAHTFQSRVYEYYDPAISATARPVVLEVRPR